jgi:glutathionyl-hydroquinone reductase
MNRTIRLRCVDPTQKLTKGGVYTSRRTIRKKGLHSTHFVDWDRATHVLVMNDSGQTVRTLANRFKKVDEQEESQATTEG